METEFDDDDGGQGSGIEEEEEPLFADDLSDDELPPLPPPLPPLPDSSSQGPVVSDTDTVCSLCILTCSQGVVVGQEGAVEVGLQGTPQQHRQTIRLHLSRRENPCSL